ncbi:YcfL family protein [Superficieibacter sp.]|uniref:YcfL family protein n=1 Tax=Superficieibacter sp. TaxID=2303322 RepID=UPI0028ADA3E3|nr:YcfL family protein [Superficieibacter sp.]
MIRGRFAALLVIALLAGCRSSHPEIPVGEQQTLVMEATVLAAGISAQPPELKNSDIQASASSALFNERNEPITVHYRFYWYDGRGLEMHPLEAPRSVTIPGHSGVTLFSTANGLGAEKVRLYLYL